MSTKGCSKIETPTAGGEQQMLYVYESLVAPLILP